MKINWKVRLQHKPFLVALFSLVLLLVQQVAASIGYDTTIYNEQLTNIFKTILAILVLVGVVTDPTTDGFFDSNRSLKYEEPNKDWG